MLPDASVFSARALTWCELKIRDHRRELIGVERLVRLVDSLGDLFRHRYREQNTFSPAEGSKEFGGETDLDRSERPAVDVVELAVPRWSAMRRRGFRDQAFDADGRRAVFSSHVRFGHESLRAGVRSRTLDPDLDPARRKNIGGPQIERESSPLDRSFFESLHDGLFSRNFKGEVEVEERGEGFGRKEVGKVGAEGRRDRGLQEDLALAAGGLFPRQIEKESVTSLPFGRERVRTP